MQPRLAEALATGDRDTANHLYQTATGWLVLVTWPINLLVMLFAPVYLRVFGARLRGRRSVVVVLAGAMLVATGCGMVDMVLAMAGRTSWNLVNVLIALGVTIGLDVLLIPRYGALGASIGLASAMVANNLLPLIQVGRVARPAPVRPRHPGGGAAVAGLPSARCRGLVTALAGRGPAGLTLAVVLGVPVFAGRRLAAARPARLECISVFDLQEEDQMTTEYSQVFQDEDAVEKYEIVTYAPDSVRVADQRAAARLPARAGDPRVRRRGRRSSTTSPAAPAGRSAPCTGWSARPTGTTSRPR